MRCEMCMYINIPKCPLRWRWLHIHKIRQMETSFPFLSFLSLSLFHYQRLSTSHLNYLRIRIQIINKRDFSFKDGLNMISRLKSLAVLGISSLILLGCAAEVKTEVNLQPESPSIQVAQLPAAHASYVKRRRSSISSPAGSIKSALLATQLFKRAGRKWITEEEVRLVELRE